MQLNTDLNMLMKLVKSWYKSGKEMTKKVWEKLKPAEKNAYEKAIKQSLKSKPDKVNLLDNVYNKRQALGVQSPGSSFKYGGKTLTEKEELLNYYINQLSQQQYY